MSGTVPPPSQKYSHSTSKIPIVKWKPTIKVIGYIYILEYVIVISYNTKIVCLCDKRLMILQQIMRNKIKMSYHGVLGSDKDMQSYI